MLWKCESIPVTCWGVSSCRNSDYFFAWSTIDYTRGMSDSCPNDVLEIGRNLMRSCNTARLCTLYLHSYVQERRNVKQKIVASVLSTDHRPLRLATDVCPRARAQQAFIWRLDQSTCWRSGRRRQTSSRQTPASGVSHVTADWLFMSVQHRFQTVSRSQIQKKMPAMSKNLTGNNSLYYESLLCLGISIRFCGTTGCM